MSPSMVDILAARDRIRSQVDVTPLRHSEWLTSRTGTPVALKLECIQRTGSFKIRGALNALMQLEGSDVATASAGNHGRAVALAAKTLGMRATVFAPRDAPSTKVAAITQLGATLHAEASYDAAESAARAFAREEGVPFVSAYNNRDVIAGAGTIALELFETEPAPSAIVVPVGGGGLISGIAIVVKAIAPAVRVLGVEAEASTAMSTSIRAGRIVEIQPTPTLADGLAGNLEPGSITFHIVQRCVDDIVTVSEEEIARAISGLLSHEHLVVEGAGAVAVAAILSGRVNVGGTAIAIVSGANVDTDRLVATLREQPRD